MRPPKTPPAMVLPFDRFEGIASVEADNVLEVGSGIFVESATARGVGVKLVVVTTD